MRAARWSRVNIGSGVAPGTGDGVAPCPAQRRPARRRGDAPHPRRPLAGEGITVNSILTGSILTTNLSYWNWLAGETGATFEEVTEQFHARIPLRRQGRPEEMASLVAFLCSEQAGRITGQSIPVDGGISRHL